MSQEQKKDNIFNVYITRSRFVKENKNSVLLKIADNILIWFDKKFIKKNDYCLTANLGIVKSWKYKNVATFSKQVDELTGTEILDLLSKMDHSSIYAPSKYNID